MKKKDLKMFKIINFKWLLKLIYAVAKLSGFFFVSINFENLTLTKNFWHYAFVVYSFGLSFATIFYDAYFPLVEITHSKIMELGINLIFASTVWIVFLLKLTTFAYSDKFFKVIKNLHWCCVKVSLK